MNFRNTIRDKIGPYFPARLFLPATGDSTINSLDVKEIQLKESQFFTWDVKVPLIRDSPQTFKFSAGSTFELESKWEFYPREICSPKGGHGLGIFLKISELPRILEKNDMPLLASFDVTLIHPKESKRNIEISGHLPNDFKNVTCWGVKRLTTSESLADFQNSEGKVQLSLNFHLFKNTKEVVGRLSEVKAEIRAKCEESSGIDILAELRKPDPTCTDVTLKTVDGWVFQAHRVVLQARSQYFRQYFLEQQQNRIGYKVGREDPWILEVAWKENVMRVLMCHMYRGTLHDHIIDPRYTTTEMAAELVEAANDHGLEGLREYMMSLYPGLVDHLKKKKKEEDEPQLPTSDQSLFLPVSDASAANTEADATANNGVMEVDDEKDDNQNDENQDENNN